MALDRYRFARLIDSLQRSTFDDLAGALEDIAPEMADDIVVSHRDQDELLIVGLGGEFEELCAPVCAVLEDHQFKLSINCFWPYRSFSPNDSGIGQVVSDDQGRIIGEELILLRGSYIEDPNSSFERSIILTTIVCDPEPLMSIIRRTRELADCRSMELRCVVATRDALDALRQEVDIRPMAVVADIPTDYWGIEETLDQRPLRLVPRQSRWLVGRQFPEVRLDKTYGLRR
ncbi:hypothetical protein [Rhizobium sp. 11515TR]|uniref:hypothetical protein n=1 Tax=Rhizobium sp. 11515TR TaxID=2028343 RepID=UPI000BA88BEF|nr:hypothetical protein [Rhizobium sp. 11515TR]ASW06400.1 hypothetical protein CKA34_11220 [Rhizobium sp. 11515TR]